MNNLLGDWEDFRAGSADFDTSHFTQLFVEHRDEASVRRALIAIPGADEMVCRVMNIVANTESRRGRVPLQPVGQLDNLLGLAHRHLRQLRKVPASTDDQELLEIIDAARPQPMYDRDEFERIRLADGPHGWLLESVGDYLRDQLDGKKVSYALMEAFYGLTSNFYLQAYVAEPMVGIDIEFIDYFDLWRLGGDHVLTHSELLVSSRNISQ